VSETVAQPIKFAVVGAGGFAVNLAAFAVVLGVGVTYVAASLIAFLVSSALIYVGNRCFTFRLGRRGFVAAYVRSTLVAGVVAGLNTMLLVGLVEAAGADPRFAQALSLAALTPVAFMLTKRWTFQVNAA
jgi:putative flippase GtrA